MVMVFIDLYDGGFCRLLLDVVPNLITIHSYTYVFYPILASDPTATAHLTILR